MRAGLLHVETTAGLRTYSADDYRKYGSGSDRVLLVFRDKIVLSEFNYAHVIRVEWARRPTPIVTRRTG